MGILHAVTALAQDHRLAALRLLIQTGNEGLVVGAIAEKLDGLPSSLSFDLALLMAGIGDMSLQTRRMEIGSRGCELAVS